MTYRDRGGVKKEKILPDFIIFPEMGFERETFSSYLGNWGFENVWRIAKIVDFSLLRCSIARNDQRCYSLLEQYDTVSKL